MVHELILKRKSIVLFSDEQIKTDQIDELFEAARWAPSSNNLQPWRFVFAIKGDPEYISLLGCLAEKNQEWAQNASMLLLTVAQTISEYNNQQNIYAWHDTGMAYANLVFQAVSIGLFVHPMGGFDREMAREVAQLPRGYDPVALAAIGHKSNSTNLPVHLIERENRQRERKLIKEFVFRGKFGQLYHKV